MTPYEIISKKREGRILTDHEVHYFIREFLKGNIKDYQMTAFLMAVYFRGMNFQETLALTNAYLQSGQKLNLTDISLPKIDKHSTGGVGDKVSLILAPLAASLGIAVPMLSGRGLGHTGGTLDKLESIPGFRVDANLRQLKKQIRDIGVAMFGQSEEFVPADRKIYALRDVTATVESLPLIVASIMSKKLAEGIDGLVLDVKIGSGAVFQQPTQAEILARNLIRVGQAFDKKVVAYLTSMDQPLGQKIGNWLEVEESLDCLQGKGPGDLRVLVVELTAEMLRLAGIAENKIEARRQCQKVLGSGAAFEKMLQLVHYQGGEIKFLQHPEKFARAKYRHQLKAIKSGYIAEINTREIGLVSVLLGAGRRQVTDRIDPSAGIILFKKIGDAVQAGEPLLEIHTNNGQAWNQVKPRLEAAIKISSKSRKAPELIFKRIASC